MWKKVVFAFAITGLLAATAVPLSAREYKHSGCADAAKMRFPEDRAARKEFKHWCKAQWKIYKDDRHRRRFWTLASRQRGH
jgi:hypothetical protein